MTMAKIDWEQKKSEARTAIKDAEARLAKFKTTGEWKEFQKAIDDNTDAEKARQAAYIALNATARGTEVRLGIRNARTNDGMRHFTKEFLAAAAEQIGCTVDEASDMTGLNSFRGQRVTGRELYFRVLGRIEDVIVNRDPAVVAARKEYKRRQDAERVSEDRKNRLERQHAEVVDGPRRAQNDLGRIEYAENEAAEKNKRVKKRSDGKKVVDPALAAKLAKAKANLLKLEEHHTIQRNRYDNFKVTHVAAPVTWWKG